MASLLAASEKRTEKRMKREMKAMLASNTKTTRPLTKLGRTNKHSWDYQFGKGKDFTDRHSFLQWLHEKPENVTKSVTKNNLKWYWCTTCGRYTSHKTADCKKTNPKSEKVTAMLAESHKTTSTYDASTDDQYQMSDSESSTDTYGAKKLARSISPSK